MHLHPDYVGNENSDMKIRYGLEYNISTEIMKNNVNSRLHTCVLPKSFKNPVFYIFPFTVANERSERLVLI